MLRIGIVAGEASGDSLGYDLIRRIQQAVPDVQFEGIGGPLMEFAGCHLLYPSEKLAVMGLVEVAGRYMELASIRRKIIQHFKSSPPDIFIGIDSPDFNLSVELELRAAGIKTVHYVGPTVWAWRAGRLDRIKKAVDLMVVLFPFEVPIYQEKGINVVLASHPAVDAIQPVINQSRLKESLGVDLQRKVIAFMPGSRCTEIDRILPIQIQVIEALYQQNPKLMFITNVVSQDGMALVQKHLSKIGNPQIESNLKVFQNQSREVLGMADAGLLTSGTITLEAMLYQLPMVVMYKMNWLSYQIIKSLVYIKYASLPNLLAGKQVVPEFIQDDCVPDKIVPVMQEILKEDTSQVQLDEFKNIREQLVQPHKGDVISAILNLT